jgi:aryl-alcohol dehydrogenase-like predicted oxidoreductase
MTDARFATPEGTAAYTARRRAEGVSDDVRGFDGLTLSSVGLGTYLGATDSVTDRFYEAAVGRALELGCNVIDTAINYRCQRSERAVGRAIAAAIAAGTIRRDQVLLATKGGYIHYDGEPPPDPAAYFRQTFVLPGLVAPDEVVAGSHSLAPAFLQHQLDHSLANLNVSCIDLYYLHNPETQLEEVPAERFYRRMRAAFETLERNVQAGKIRSYGVATWNGLRATAGAGSLVSIEQLVGLAREVAGDRHRFRVIQLPYSLAMPEAATRKNQPVKGTMMTPIEAAGALGVYIMGSAALYQSRLAQRLPSEIRNHLGGLKTDAQRAIQFARSTPGVGTALVGMKQVGHVEDNLATLTVPPLAPDVPMRLLGG